MSNTFHVAVYVRSIPEAVEQYRKLLGIEPAKVRHDYAKFELTDPPVIFSLNVAKADVVLSVPANCLSKSEIDWFNDAYSGALLA